MAYTYYNPNPVGRFVEDCTVRALSKALDIDWDGAHVLLDMASLKMGTMSHDNDAIASVLRQNGFYRDIIPNACQGSDCYTAEDFCNDHPTGKYVLGFGSHVTAVKDGVMKLERFWVSDDGVGGYDHIACGVWCASVGI